ncbi:phosphopantetheine-binding protein [Streptomyces sp. NPDC052396]|uniref:phosphopantetheine-binding protein n=1 Tax=Streptomyces sp. NPDC052396 TaxID=3365689 RepID=UPI0037CCE5D1
MSHPLEQEIAAIWADVLGLERVGPQDDFTDLGGNSLHAMRIISSVEELIDAELSLRVLLETRTVAGMAERIDAMRAGE